jgi:hypothetical protein
LIRVVFLNSKNMHLFVLYSNPIFKKSENIFTSAIIYKYLSY